MAVQLAAQRAKAWARLGDRRQVEVYARQVMLTGDRNPMRASEAHMTLGIVAARTGDLEQAVAWGGKAREPGRKSLPHLVMNSSELRRLLEDRYPNDPLTTAYTDMLGTIKEG